MAKRKSIRNRIQTAVVVVLVSMLSLVFVLEFGGPQSQGCAEGGGTYAARVHGQVITEGDFEATYTLANFNQYPPETQRDMRLKEVALEGLIERALLARKAREMGFEVTEEEVWKHLGEEGTVYLSLGVDAPPDLPQGELPVPVQNENGEFDTERARRFIQFYLRRSVGEFAEAQVQEFLAERARAVIRSTVSVSPQEVWQAFVREREQARIAYVRFSPSHYQNQVDPSEQQLQAWMKDHAEKIEREYQANEHRYTDLEEQVRARHILLRVPADANDETRDDKRAKAEEILSQVRGGADFAELAREESEDPGSAARGGDLGWNPRGRMVPEFDDVQFSLEPGQLSDVVETEFGFHIIKVEETREGDVPEEEAKREIASRLYRGQKAESLARKAAEQTLARLGEGVDLDVLDAELGGPEPAREGGEDAEGDDALAESSEAESDPRGPNAPKVERTEPFGRGESPLPAGMDAGPLIEAAFERSADDPLPEEPLKVGGDWFVFKVVERTEATREDFTEETRQRLLQSLRGRKADEALRIYVERLREEAEDEGAIRFNEAVLSYGDEAGPEQAS